MSDLETLIVDDDFRVARIHAEYVEKTPGFTVAGVEHTAAGCIAAIARLRPELVLLDLYLPDEHGLALLRRLHAGPGPYPDVIAITAARDLASVRSAMQLGVVHYLVKPFRFETLAERLRAYRELKQRSLRTGEADQSEVDQLFGLLRAAEAEPLPKGHSVQTLALVRRAFDAAGEIDLSAAEVAQRIGVSRPTAQRYLSHLVRTGVLEVHLRYGTAGRPEHRYRRQLA